MLRKINLTPTLGAAQFPDPLSCRRADVPCHPFMIGLAFALYLAHTLSGGQMRRNLPIQERGGMMWLCVFKRRMTLTEQQRKKGMPGLCSSCWCSMQESTEHLHGSEARVSRPTERTSHFSSCSGLCFGLLSRPIMF